MSRWLAVVLMTGCGFNPGGSGGGSADAPGDEGGPDVPVDTSSPLCFGSIVPVCLVALPTLPYTTTVLTTINTDSATCAATTNPEAAGYCVLAGTSVTLANSQIYTAHGNKPLVLLSTSSMTISAFISVASTRLPAVRGAGALAASATLDCPPGTASTYDPTANNGQGAGGGGYGGSFSGPGATGESINSNATGGIAGATVVPTRLRGGCPGFKPTAIGGGDGGVGGGAIALIAAGSLTFQGSINASGAGGGGGTANQAGGGGGGSGGMIVLDAPTITFVSANPAIWANGGGGGEADGSGQGTSAGESVGPALPALGGASVFSGGDGGAGSSGATRNAPAIPGNHSGAGGGGAGGGGAGVIRATGSIGTNISPPLS